MSPTKLKLRFAQWISGYAGSVCAWAYELERKAEADLPKCPDCGIEPWDGDPDAECWTCSSIHSQKAEDWTAHHEVWR